jgi:hypothetical protein
MTSINPTSNSALHGSNVANPERRHQAVSNARPRKRFPVIGWVGVGIGGFVALVGGIFVLVWTLTAGAVDTTNTFLSHVGNGRYEAAYSAAAPQFRAQHSLESFRAAMQRFGLHRYKSASWSSRQFSNGRVTLDGTIQTRDGQQFSATVVVVQSQNKWMVYSLQIGTPGVISADVSSPGTPRKLPPAGAMNRLVLKSLLAFNASVRSKDFRAFHAALARPMRDKFSPEHLKRVFEAFIRHQMDISAIRRLDPVFTQNPSIDSDGQLIARGFYPTKPGRVNFKLSFMMEGGKWRLTGINISVS